MKRIINFIIAVMLAMLPLTASAEFDKPTITATIYDRGNIPESVGTLSDNPVVTWLNENSPVNVEFVPISRWQSTEALSAMFAANNAPDLIFDYGAPMWYQEGLTAPLNTLLEENSTQYYDTLKQYPNAIKLATPIGEEEMHYFVRVWPATNNHTLVVRKDWLDALGLDIPTDLESFKQVLLAFTNDDPDGNGVDDTYGINGSFIGGQLIRQIFCAEIPFVNEEGQIVLSDDNIVAAYEFKKWLFDNNIIDKDYLTDTSGEKATADFISGHMGFLPQSNGVIESAVRELYNNDPDAEVIAIPYPKTDRCSVVGAIQGGIATVGFVNAASDKGAECVQYVDFLQRDDVYARIMFGVEGEHFNYDENGVPVRSAEQNEKYLAEMQWASGADYCMPYAKINMPSAWLDPRMAITEDSDRATIDIANINYQATCMLFEEGRVVPSIATSVTLPTDIQFIYDSVSSVENDMWEKAVVSGDSYTVADAKAELDALKASVNYDAYVEFMTNWYNENKDDIYLNTYTLELKPAFVE